MTYRTDQQVGTLRFRCTGGFEAQQASALAALMGFY